MRITTAVGKGAIRELKSEWTALQGLCPTITPWQTWEWNDTWWSLYGSRRRLHVVMFHNSAGELVGLAPLCISPYLGTPLRRLSWVGTGPSDYLKPLALPKFEHEVCSGLIAHLSEGPRDWDVADLQQLPEGAAMLNCASRVADCCSVSPLEPCPYLSLPGNWAALNAGFSKKFRYNLGYYDRLLARDVGETTYRTASEETLERDLDTLFDLHQRRWRARSLPGALALAKVQTLHRTSARRFLANGWLRLHMLEAGGETVGALYCYALNSRTFYYLGGFSLDHHKYSPGMLVTAAAVKQAIGEGCTEFDFLRGHEPYKYRWCSDHRMNQRILILRSERGVSGRLGMLLHRAENYVVVNAKAMAERQTRRSAGSESA